MLGGGDGHPALYVDCMAICTFMEGNILRFHCAENRWSIGMESLLLDGSEDGAADPNRG